MERWGRGCPLKIYKGRRGLVKIQALAYENQGRTITAPHALCPILSDLGVR